jgi:hypothetical protein
MEDNGRVLVFGTSYLASAEAGRTLRVWDRLVSRNDCDVLVVDSDSPGKSCFGGLGYAWHQSDSGDLFDYVIRDRKTAISFRDNIGHLNNALGQGFSLDGKAGALAGDGWGRAFCQGIKVAIDCGYRYAVHVETDLYYFKDLLWPLAHMNDATRVIGLVDPVCGRFETALMWMDVRCLAEIDFIRRYDWRIRNPDPLPEDRVLDIVVDHATQIDLHGYRVDGVVPDEHVIGMLDRYDYITHVSGAVFEEIERRLGL